MRLCRLAVPLLLLAGCTSVDMYYPETFWADRVSNREPTERFVRHWNVLLATPVLWSEIEREIGREAGWPSANRQGNVLRVSSPDCPGYSIQERFEVWKAMQEMYPHHRFAEVNLDYFGTGTYTGKERALTQADEWVLRQRRRQSWWINGKEQTSFDHFWGIYRYNGETKKWDRKVRNLLDRRAAERTMMMEDGWLWKLVPCMPSMVYIDERGRVPEGGFICGTLFRRELPEFDAWSERMWKLPREERRAIMQEPVTDWYRDQGRELAKLLGARLGLEQ
jgi:hypothetical protein